MTRLLVSILSLVALLPAGDAVADSPARPRPDAAAGAACDVSAATPWIEKWFAAWDLTSREILRLPDAPPPNVVFFDTVCVFTTSGVTAPKARAVRGPALRGTRMSWRAASHGDSITLPNGTAVTPGLMSFASADRSTGPFFVMAAPSIWQRAGHGEELGLTGVFLHEFAHTRQTRGMADVLGPIDSAWTGPQELDDDVIQDTFGGDSTYAAAYFAERDLLWRAAIADSLAEVRALARQALAMMRARHERWFTGKKAVYSILDDTFLSFEGAGQWVACAWLAHPAGGRLDRETTVRRMLGSRRVWSQDQGLALFLVVDRLLPGWPALVFGSKSIGATALLARALEP